MNKITIGLIMTTVGLVLTIPFFTTAWAQNSTTESKMDQIKQATGYMLDMGDFATGCTNEMTSGNANAEGECMSVISEFNKHMEQLWQTHGDAINKYRMRAGLSNDYGLGLGSSGLGSSYGGGLYN